ncbi:MAG: hypothetical protein ABI378_11845 [Chitinophagaceae bacterium]
MRPISLKRPRPFKNLNAPYRMVFINENSLEEVASFHLTKNSLYALFSTIFIITIFGTVAILLFTPLKYYIPGYGSNQLRIEAMALEHRVDSLSAMVVANQQKASRISAIIAEKDVVERDTAMLKPSLLNNLPEGVIPAPDDIKSEASQETKIQQRNARRKK